MAYALLFRSRNNASCSVILQVRSFHSKLHVLHCCCLCSNCQRDFASLKAVEVFLKQYLKFFAIILISLPHGCSLVNSIYSDYLFYMSAGLC